MLDRAALAVDDGELARVDNEVDGTDQLVAAQFVAPGARHASDVRPHAQEKTQVRLAEARALGVRDHGVPPAATRFSRSGRTSMIISQRLSSSFHW